MGEYLLEGVFLDFRLRIQIFYIRKRSLGNIGSFRLSVLISSM
jgi:hypothetical protein